MKRVMVTSRSFGSVSDMPIKVLEDAGLQVTLAGGDFDQEQFEREIKDYDALIIGAHPFPGSIMEKCSALKIIAKHGSGLDNIDLDLARELNLTVTNVPAMNANAVADLAFGHILNIARGISLCDARVKNGLWKTHIGIDVFQKKLGLLGFGAIARNVAKRAKGFEMNVIAYDPFVKEVPGEFRDYVRLVSFEELLAECDFLSIHVPLTKDTKYLLSEDSLRKMKKGAYLINTGRGGIVKEEDLYTVLKDGHLAGAALDVTEIEPLESTNALLTLDNVVITPHIGMYSKEAINGVSMTCAENVANLFLEKKLTNVVV